MLSEDTAQRVAELFEAALQLDRAQRAAFLSHACGSHDRLWDEVSSLVAEYERTEEAAAPAAPASPRLIGRYEVGCELGRGGMGVVYQAHDPVLNRRVALKVIRLDGYGTTQDQAWLRARLLREARAAASLSHPNIVGIHDSGVHEELAYIAMELVDGPTLARRLSTGALERAESLAILRQAAAALDYSNAAGVVHRDVKPGNILLQNGSVVKITDFGIAKVTTGKQGTRTTLAAGTPAYMSPEQIRSQAVDGRSDQFSLAVVAFEMLTGSPPFRAESDFDLMKQIVDGERRTHPELPVPVDGVFARALARNSADRYGRCTDFVEALAQALAAPLPGRLRERAWIAGAAAALLVSILLALLSLLPHGQRRAVAPASQAAPRALFDGIPFRTEAILDERPGNPNRLAGARDNRNVPSQVLGVSDVVSIGGGWPHTLVVTGDGRVLSWGGNDGGQLGDGSENHEGRLVPYHVRFPELVSFRLAASGAGPSFVVTSDGIAWGWGSNNEAQIGDGTVTSRMTPVKVGGLTGVTAVSSGHAHSLALTRDGSVWTWGALSRTSMGGPSGPLQLVPVRIPALRNIRGIAAGELFSLAVDHEGAVWAWGRNIKGVLGDGTTIDHPTPVRVAGLSGFTAVATSMHHSVALKDDGTVWAWGQNSYGELGDGTLTDRWRPVKVQGLENVMAIAANSQHTLALKRDGTVWGWGQNSYGALGDGTWIDRHTPVRAVGLAGVSAIAAGGQHSLARKNDGTLWTWGWNEYGQLGRQSIRELDSTGATTITVNYAQSTGPMYAMANGGFPWILFDRGSHRILIQPGKAGTSQWGAALGYDVRADADYAIRGSFQRANTFPGAGDGVDAAIILDDEGARPLWSRHIDAHDLAVHPFSTHTRLRRGQIVRFVVFSGPQGKDGNFDETALQVSIAKQ